ncbi:MAG: sugar transferase, partial [Lachnospiraceae bacterium]|nr:sugar transferase [Lachnospiraceae bacterium]
MSQEYAGAVKYAQKVPAKISGKKRIYSFLKRSGDVAVSLTGIILCSPVFLFLAVLVYMDDPGPVLFAHERVGRNGQKIRVWKFRSMRVDAEDIFQGFTKEQKEMFYRDFKL